jgi:hypothetical protein
MISYLVSKILKLLSSAFDSWTIFRGFDIYEIFSSFQGISMQNFAHTS